MVINFVIICSGNVLKGMVGRDSDFFFYSRSVSMCVVFTFFLLICWGGGGVVVDQHVDQYYNAYSSAQLTSCVSVLCGKSFNV